ncbi:MAG: hypothetical protein P1U40_11225 [Coxiellaceae bacterium]|nr:hypothetical protein [Coxiellaceae bacterium]
MSRARAPQFDDNAHQAEHHLTLSAKLYAGAVTTFILGSSVLLHELLHDRRRGMYFVGDALLLTALILAPVAGYQLNRGLNKVDPAPVELKESINAGLLDGAPTIKKPFAGIASRYFTRSAITLGVVGAVLSACAVAEENYRIYKGYDKNVTLATEAVLGIGALLTVAASAVAVFAVKQKIWEKQHPGHGTATSPYDEDYDTSCLARFRRM